MAVALGGLAGCEQGNTYVEPPPPEVTVSAPVRRAVTSYLEYTGTARAVATVEVRARVEGYLESLQFEDGQEVRQGDLLFQIDPRPFRAKVDAARADLASKQARLTQLESDYARDSRLRQRNAITAEEFVATQAGLGVARAEVEAAKAALQTAELDLGYTRVTAPIAGRITRRQVDVGNLVGDGEATLLATIVEDHQVYAYFTVSETDLLRFRSLAASGARPDYRDGTIPIDLGLADERGYPHTGRLEYMDPAVDPATGTVVVRGIFENEDHRIIPGLFVRVRVPLEQGRDALLVPERALGVDQVGQYLLVVNDEDVVEQRPVEVGTRVEGLRVVESNLGPEDRVVVNGIQRARPGTAVVPKPAGSLEALAVSTDRRGPAPSIADSAFFAADPAGALAGVAPASGPPARK